MARSRCACFTLNNWTEEEKKAIISLDTYTYLIIGHEQGGQNTPHLQGYIEFKKKQSFSVLKKFNKRIHWEPRRGKQNQAIDYCKKEGNFEEYGEPKKQGDRIDLKKQEK